MKLRHTGERTNGKRETRPDPSVIQKTQRSLLERETERERK